MALILNDSVSGTNTMGRKRSAARRNRIWTVLIALGLFTISTIASAETLTPIPVKTTKVDEFTAAAEGDWLSWTQNSTRRPNHYNVYAQQVLVGVPSSGRKKVNARGTEAATGGIEGTTLVYNQYRGNSAGNILRFNLVTNRRSGFPKKVNTPYDEYHPTISGSWVLFTRYNSDSESTKVLLYNMSTRALRVLGSGSGRRREVYSGQVNGDYAAWGRIRPSGDDVFLYHIPTNTTTKIPRPVFAQYDPSVTSDGTMYYHRSGNECGASVKLVRYPQGGPATVLFDFPFATDGGYTYVDERHDGSLDVYYGRVGCRRFRWDIFKVVDSHTLTVSKQGGGTGVVESNPSGISCGSDCEQIYHGGIIVELTATPDPGSVLAAWSDPACGTNATCSVTIDADKSVTVTFEEP
jgi:hypothetical protein